MNTLVHSRDAKEARQPRPLTSDIQPDSKQVNAVGKVKEIEVSVNSATTSFNHTICVRMFINELFGRLRICIKNCCVAQGPANEGNVQS